MKKSSPNVFYKELLKNETKALVIEHELHDVTPEMIDWWWDNMDNDTYQLWHPEDHLALEWQIPPDKVGHAGAIHMACEKISDVSAQILRIRWEEPESAPISCGQSTRPRSQRYTLGCVVHEYEEARNGTVPQISTTIV